MLKYTFKALYKDGTTYNQNKEDISVSDPKKSCFFDLQQDRIRSFFVYNDEHTYSVNLEDGHFEVDGVPFCMHTDHVKNFPGGRQLAMPLKDFRLIFFRQHVHDIKVTVEKNEEIDHRITYNIGWQCTVDGKNYQEVMQIK